MNSIKKYCGVIWMLLGPVAMYYLIKTAAEEISKKPVISTKIEWIGFVVIFIPVSIGLMIFGYYALKGEYDRIPQSSAEMKE